MDHVNTVAKDLDFDVMRRSIVLFQEDTGIVE
jgi:hypothetical protein